jgi:hypothetical protein
MFVYGGGMPIYELAFRDPPDRLIEKLKPVLVAQGNPPVFVVPESDEPAALHRRRRQ